MNRTVSLTDPPDYLGVGIAFPFSLDSRGRLAMARHEKDIEQAILMILLTPKGQRVMRPEFGCQIHELAFAPNDGMTAGLAAYYVESALAMWEPRIQVLAVEPDFHPEQPEILNVVINYQIKATHDRRSLVFPFYRIPGE